ncbi:MAG: phosphoribosylaminoimidazolesuccinocarboxamide synthase [Bergeyella sp.]|nr:phosphoribosylaminoimidazolesuccinocarboxamide synthase [Bergeyella sp.]
MGDKKALLYEGKAKQIYETGDPETVIVFFKDDATAFNAQKKGRVEQKGKMNNAITALVYEYLGKKGIETHFIEKLNNREQRVRKVSIVPLEVIVRNYAAGSMAKRLGVEEGVPCPETIFEICYKKDELGDPLINDHHAIFLGVASHEDLEMMYTLASRINDALKELFDRIDIILVDFKIELGKTTRNQIILADEISPDTCRLWDKKTLKKLDKDRFRRDLGEVTEAYVEIYERLKKVLEK